MVAGGYEKVAENYFTTGKKVRLKKMMYLDAILSI